MKTIKKEVTFIDMSKPYYNERKEVCEFTVYHEDREDDFCQRCTWPDYPKCLETCSVGKNKK